MKVSPKNYQGSYNINDVKSSNSNYNHNSNFNSINFTNNVSSEGEKIFKELIAKGAKEWQLKARVLCGRLNVDGNGDRCLKEGLLGNLLAPINFKHNGDLYVPWDKKLFIDKYLVDGDFTSEARLVAGNEIHANNIWLKNLDPDDVTDVKLLNALDAAFISGKITSGTEIKAGSSIFINPGTKLEAGVKLHAGEYIVLRGGYIPDGIEINSPVVFINKNSKLYRDNDEMKIGAQTQRYYDDKFKNEIEPNDLLAHFDGIYGKIS